MKFNSNIFYFINAKVCVHAKWRLFPLILSMIVSHRFRYKPTKQTQSVSSNAMHAYCSAAHLRTLIRTSICDRSLIDLTQELWHFRFIKLWDFYIKNLGKDRKGYCRKIVMKRMSRHRHSTAKSSYLQHDEDSCTTSAHWIGAIEKNCPLYVQNISPYKRK